MKGVFKCAREDDKRRFRRVKLSSLGMPPYTPKKYPSTLKHLNLGMPPCIPLSINNYQFVLRSTIFLSLHALCAMLGASCSLFLFSFSLALLSVHNKLDPSLHCLGERHAPLHCRTQHRLASLSSCVCSLSFHSCCHA